MSLENKNNSSQKNNEKTTNSSEEEIVGVGMQLDFRKKRVFAIQPLPNGPAESAGIQHEDEILEIDGQATQLLRVEELVARIRGPRGSKVVMKILRQGHSQPQVFTLVRDTVRIPEQKTTKLEPAKKEAVDRIPKPSLSLRGTEKIIRPASVTPITTALEKKN